MSDCHCECDCDSLTEWVSRVTDGDSIWFWGASLRSELTSGIETVVYSLRHLKKVRFSCLTWPLTVLSRCRALLSAINRRAYLMEAKWSAPKLIFGLGAVRYLVEFMPPYRALTRPLFCFCALEVKDSYAYKMVSWRNCFFWITYVVLVEFRALTLCCLLLVGTVFQGRRYWRYDSGLKALSALKIWYDRSSVQTTTPRLLMLLLLLVTSASATPTEWRLYLSFVWYWVIVRVVLTSILAELQE